MPEYMQTTIVVEAGREVGYGHLKRCLIIADSMRDRGISVRFMLGDLSGKGATLIWERGFPCKEFRRGEYAQLPNAIRADTDPQLNGIVLFDVSHSGIGEIAPSLGACLQQLQKYSFTLGLIDSLGSQALRNHTGDICVDLLIAPYVGEQAAGEAQTDKLYGARYFVLDPSYRGVKRAATRNNPDRIMITCGGSDPTKLTLPILRSLGRISDRVLDVLVIIGPFFDQEYVQEIDRCAEDIQHNVEIEWSPESLAEFMQWCDIAISTSGLTKYELAATGTPALLYSIDRIHQEINRAFDAEGCSLHLGIGDCLSERDLCVEVTGLLDDAARQRAMSEKGMRLVDGEGAERIIDMLLRSSSAKFSS